MKKNNSQKNIPWGWQEVVIGGHIKLQGGNAFKASNYVPEGVPLIRIGNVGKGSFVANDFVYISKDEYNRNELVHLKENDILMGMTGELGKIARIDKKYLPAVLNQRVGRIIFKDKKINPDFLYYIFISDKFKNKLEKYFIGAAQKNISSSQVESANIILPPVNEQQKIATILGAVDEDIEKTDEVIKATEKLKKGLMQQLFTRGIGHKKFKKTKLGEIPEEWEIGLLGDYLIQQPDYGVGASAVPYSEQLPGYIRITDISENGKFIDEGKKSVDHPDAKNYYLEEGDLVFARTGASVGKTYLYNPKDGRLVFAGFLIRVRANEKKLLPKYLSLLVQTIEYWNWVRVMSARSGQPGINGNEYATMPLIIPPVKEQQKFVEIIFSMDEKISINKKLKEKLILLKKGLMQDLLSGEVRVI